MTTLSRAQTEMRGWDDYEDQDYGTPFYPRKFPRQVTQRELLERPFVGTEKAVSQRCHCGRPLRDSTGQCHLGHRPPEPRHA